MPTIKLDYLNTKLTDTHVASTGPTTNYGTQSVLSVNGNGIEALIKFDLSLIPNNAIINSAFLTLGLNAGTVQPIDLYNVLSNWDETTVTWNTKPTVDTVKQATATTPNGTNLTFDIDIKSSVQQWVNGLNNFGLSIKTTSASTISFFSKDNTGTGPKPTLTIDYTIPTTDKKQVEFAGELSTDYASVAIGTTVNPAFPSNSIQPGDMLLSFVSHGFDRNLVIPTGWNLFSKEAYYGTNDTGTGIAIIYKIADGTETSIPISFANTQNSSEYVIVSNHVYRNVKEIHSNSIMTKSSSNAAQPTSDVSVLKNSLVIPVIGVLSNYLPSNKLNFNKLSSKQHNTYRGLHIYSTYTYSKENYTVIDLTFTFGSSTNQGLKVISLEPVTNEAPNLDGTDGELGVFDTPFTKSYNVSDTEGDTITITEKLNNEVIRTFTGTGTQTLDISAQWDALPLGKHTVTIEINDDYNNPPHTPVIRTWTFLKILPSDAMTKEIVQGLRDLIPFLGGKKAGVIGLIREEGGTVDDAASWDEVMMAFKGMPIRKAASGSITSAATSFAFTRSTGDTISLNRVTFDMSMLPFVPSKIVLYKADKSHAQTTVWYKENYYKTNDTTFANTNWNANSLRCPYVNGIVNLPVDATNTVYTWEAVE
ncbi:DNRLRE domain-containing protein [Peribacillus asahii]|uniref:DNRLRE domain-containing protein n=1 Tax=Peribacillus asahii TaxID=228899 RepID=UPI002079C3B9|nr:DNRLRE domain-containing protein [Peribacillus asahii]USK71775.1 DNRLRE domain-containing protein [Peribacillus asahii]